MLALLLFAGSVATLAAPAKVLMVLPSFPGALSSSEGSLTALLDEAERSGRFGKLEAVRRGSDFSTLKELITASMSGTLPDLGAIEASELPALEASKIAKPVSRALAKSLFRGADPAWARAGKSTSGVQISLPFERVLPVLLIDQELLYRVGIDPETPLDNWERIGSVSRRIADHHQRIRSDLLPVTIPLQGARGLWILEALTTHPLWKRETGGLRANRGLAQEFERIRALSSGTGRFLRTDLTWERAFQDFLDRKSPLVVSSSDALPRLRTQAGFRWKAVPLPRLDGKPSQLATGSDLVILRESPAVEKLLSVLYSPEISGRWIRAGGFIPLRRTDRPIPTVEGDLGLGGPDKHLKKLSFSGSRSTDREVVRARSAWIQALLPLFGEALGRKDVEEVLSSLDRQINSGISD